MMWCTCRCLDTSPITRRLDYSGPTGFVHELASRVSRIIILDHHKTAQEQLCMPNSNVPGNGMCGTVWWVTTVEVRIRMDKSGCGIALDYFSSLLPTDVLLFGKSDRYDALPCGS